MKIFNKKFNQAISIGCDCGPATRLRDAGKRDCSYPFDWMVTNSTSAVAETLMGDFKNFTIVKKEIGNGCKKIRFVNSQGLVFFHHSNLSKENLTKKFNKKILNFRKKMKENVLLIRREHGSHVEKCENTSKESIKLLEKTIFHLRKKYNNQNIDCVVIISCKHCANNYSSYENNYITVVVDENYNYDKALDEIVNKIYIE